MGLKTFFTIILLLVGCATPQPTFSTSSEPFHRFWRGYRKPSVPVDEFGKILNRSFFPQTIALKKLGLISYQPAIVKKPIKGCQIPDEVALVTYQDEASYKQMKATEEGKQYSDAHWKIFDQSRSISLVPIQFTGMVENGQAYQIDPAFTDYQNTRSVLRVICSAQDRHEFHSKIVDLYEFTKAQKLQLGIKNVVFLFAGDYAIELLSLDEKAATNAEAWATRNGILNPKRVQIQEILLKKEKVSDSFVRAGGGRNFQF